jgi:hypothetical protein
MGSSMNAGLLDGRSVFDLQHHLLIYVILDTLYKA